LTNRVLPLPRRRPGELLDLDRADRLERNLFEIRVRDHDVFTGRVFIALDGLGARDRRVLDRHHVFIWIRE